jgi:hypothetical protein
LIVIVSGQKHPVPDFTLISQRSGGEFPYQRVKGIIEGTEPGLLAHGDREMPIWGPIFHEIKSDQDWGEVRLDAITKHIASIQQKEVACDLDRGKPVMTAVRLLTKFVTLMSSPPRSHKL